MRTKSQVSADAGDEVLAAHPRPRDRDIDALKLVAIALVVFTHVLAQPRFAGLSRIPVHVIEMLNMPLFALVSGYLVGLKPAPPLSSVVSRRFQTLMLPRYSWVTISYLVGGGVITSLPAFLILETWQPTLWFLYVLFVCHVVAGTVRRLPRPTIGLVLTAVAVAALWPVLDGTKVLGGFRLPWLYPFFAIGVLLGEYGALRAILTRVPWYVFALTFAALAAVFMPVGVASDPWVTVVTALPAPFVLLVKLFGKYVVGALGVVACWSLIAAAPRRIVSVLALGGPLSLGVYVMHEYFFGAVFGSGWIGAVASSSVIVLVCLGLTRLILVVPIARVLLLGAAPRRRPLDG